MKKNRVVAKLYILYRNLLITNDVDISQGHMNWTHVPVSVSSHIISVENPMKTYQFAISANRQILQRNYFNNIFHFTSNSSGLIWEACTAIRSKSNVNQKYYVEFF